MKALIYRAKHSLIQDNQNKVTLVIVQEEWASLAYMYRHLHLLLISHSLGIESKEKKENPTSTCNAPHSSLW